MFRLYKDSVTTLNDISGKVFEISPIAYRINDDWSFELPELNFKSTAELAEDDLLFVTDDADEDVLIRFYVKKITYDYTTKLYSYKCLHVFMKLDNYKAYEVPILGDGLVPDWSDITPGYVLYNNDYSDMTGPGRPWRRQYFQALYLLKVLMHKVSGVGINSVDSTAVDEVNSFYVVRRDIGGGSYVNQAPKYKELAITIGCLHRLGTKYNGQWNTSDYWERRNLPSLLTVMKCVCQAMGVYIDVFRADFAIKQVALAVAPSGILTSYESETVEALRDIKVRVSRLVGSVFDFVFGEYIAPEWEYSDYTYGVDDAVCTVEEFTGKVENESNLTYKTMDVGFPNFMRLYVTWIDSYQSYIYAIQNDETGADELGQIAQAYDDYWGAVSERIKYEQKLSAISFRAPYTELDMARKTARYERLA